MSKDCAQESADENITDETTGKCKSDLCTREAVMRPSSSYTGIINLLRNVTTENNQL